MALDFVVKSKLAVVLWYRVPRKFHRESRGSDDDLALLILAVVHLLDHASV